MTEMAMVSQIDCNIYMIIVSLTMVFVLYLFILLHEQSNIITLYVVDLLYFQTRYPFFYVHIIK